MRERERRGSVIVLVAVLMVVLLGFGAFAVDLSQMQAYKSELKRAADAAVLAATLQLLHETRHVDARIEADAYLRHNPVFGDSATITGFEYGTYNDVSGFTPLCTGCSAVATAIRLSIQGPERGFYLAQLLPRDSAGPPRGETFTVNAVATAWLPVTATPCAAPWAVHDTIWWNRYRGSIPGPTTLRRSPLSQNLFALKSHELPTDVLPKWFGAINLPGLTTSGVAHNPGNGVDNYTKNINPGPPWSTLGGQHCHTLIAGDLLQAKNGALDSETGSALQTPGLCAALYNNACHNAGGQAGFAVRIPIVVDTVGGLCDTLPVYGEDDFGGNTAKCLRVVDVLTFVVVAIGAGSEEGFVGGVYAGTDTIGPVRGYAQRPILVQ